MSSPCFGELQFADDFGAEQAHDIGEAHREPEAREQLLGDRGTAQDVALLEHERLHPGPCQVGRADQAVVTAADDDRVVPLGQGDDPPTWFRHAQGSMRVYPLRHTLETHADARRRLQTVSVGSPFHPRTAPLNRKMQWREWSGYFASSAYADAHDIEYNAVREAAALFDVSPLYKYLVSGPDAMRLVDRVITRDATKLPWGGVVLHPVVRRERQGR